jgi:hypothetical protein
MVPAYAQVREEHAENGSDSASHHLGYPEDWSSRHLVISSRSAAPGQPRSFVFSR